MQEGKDNIEQCVIICAQALKKADQVRNNDFEDISAAEDAQQVVTTLEDSISARRVTAGNRATQWLGQMSDATLQQLSRDLGHPAVRDVMKPQIAEIEGRIQSQLSR